jgi:hypothetical protein
LPYRLGAPNLLCDARLLIDRLILQNPRICRAYIPKRIDPHVAVLLHVRKFMCPHNWVQSIVLIAEDHDVIKRNRGDCRY